MNGSDLPGRIGGIDRGSRLVPMKLMFFVVQKQRMDDVIEKNDGAIKSDECQTAGRIPHLARFWCLRDQVSTTFISGQGRIADVDMT